MTNPGDAVGTNGGYGGRTSVNAFNDILAAFSGRGIVQGWQCVPKGGMTVALGGQDLVRDVAIVENDIGQCTTLNNISTQPIDITLSAAPTLGSRIDVIVGYVTNPPDSNGELIDNPDACGLIAVESVVTTNPTAPDEAMIREAITADGGSGVNAYYVVLATVNIGTGMTTITNTEITPGAKSLVNVAEIMNFAGDNGLAFGLGGNCIDMSNTDLNLYPPRTGFYMGVNGANRPTSVQSSDDWWYVAQMVHNATFRVQIARSFFDASQVWQRVMEGGNWKPWSRIQTQQNTLDQTYPVGALFKSYNLDTPEKVAAALGGGTWVRTSEAQAIVGYASFDGDFNESGKTGGSKTVTLTVDQIPAHTHDVEGAWAGGSASGNRNTISGYPTTSRAGEYRLYTQTIGGGQAHNNLQPYVTVYIYCRTA